MLSTGDLESDKTGSKKKVDTPWHYWKWIIVGYQACFVQSATILVNFWITEFSDDEFLIYTGSGGDILWDLVTTVPFLLILIEYPFNQIPVSWGMLFFNLIIICTYLLLNFILVTSHDDNSPIYEDFDWYNKPLSAFGMVFVLLFMTCLVFAVLWTFTMKVKLPAYADSDN